MAPPKTDLPEDKYIGPVITPTDPACNPRKSLGPVLSIGVVNDQMLNQVLVLLEQCILPEHYAVVGVRDSQHAQFRKDFAEYLDESISFSSFGGSRDPGLTRLSFRVEPSQPCMDAGDDREGAIRPQKRRDSRRPLRWL